MLPANLAEPERYYEFWRLVLAWGIVLGLGLAAELVLIVWLLVLILRKG